LLVNRRRETHRGYKTKVIASVGLLGLKSFRKSNRHERAGFALYGAAVGAAREPYLYEALGVPDTLDGRFDLIVLHAFLLVRHLRELPEPGPALAQAVFDAMFSDMDVNLREIGVGYLSVGRKVRAMWEAFHGRASAYQAAIDQDEAALSVALARNVWRGGERDARSDALARIVIRQDAALAAADPAGILSGIVAFEPVEAA
jgi:cytochrome b pre-mRNA-processing protein 3